MSDDFRKFVSSRPADEIEILKIGSDPAGLPVTRHRVARNQSRVDIFVAMLDRALGEFIIKSVYAAAVKCQFSDAFMTLYFHDDRPYKKAILDLNPHINKALEAAPKITLPIEYFYGFGDRAQVPGADQFIKLGLAYPDLMITPSMVYATDPMRFDYIPYLGVPVDRQDALDQELVDLGLNPNKWFCCLYYREPGYKAGAAAPRRDVLPEAYRRLTEWIVRDLGGQVVRIGHPGMTAFPDMPGFVDLSRYDDKFMLQSAAVARARFGVVTSSGPAALFSAFGTPHVITNAIGISTNWRSTDFSLPRHFQAPDATFLDIDQAIAGGHWNERTILAAMEEGGYKPVDNSLVELQAATTRLLEETEDTPGWRAHRDVLADAARYTKRPEQHVTNGPFKHPARIIQFPELAPDSAPGGAPFRAL